MTQDRTDRPISAARRLRLFVRAYLATGSAAQAARAADYRGRYAAQSGYKLLHYRAAVLTEVRRHRRVDQRLLRRQVLQALGTAREVLAASDPSSVDFLCIAESLCELLERAGLADHPCHLALRARLNRKNVNFRRFYRLPWEEDEPLSRRREGAR